jgi:exodeoxyribonuclease-3
VQMAPLAHSGWLMWRSSLGSYPTRGGRRGQAFDTDAGWRRSLALRPRGSGFQPRRRAESYDTRWSDHTPVVVDYNL